MTDIEQYDHDAAGTNLNHTSSSGFWGRQCQILQLNKSKQCIKMASHDHQAPHQNQKSGLFTNI